MNTETQEPVSLSVTQAKTDMDGVSGYNWPVTQAEILAFRDDLLAAARDIIRAHKDGDESGDWKVLHVSYIRIVTEILMIYRSWRALAYYRGRQAEVEAPEEFFPYITAMQKGESLLPAVHQRLSFLKHNINGPNPFLRPLRRFKHMFKKSAFRRKTIREIRDDDIVTFATSPFIERHAERVLKEEGKRIVLCSFWEWYEFLSGNKPEFEDAPAQMNAAQSEFYTAMEAVIRKHGYDIPEDIKEAIQTYIRIKDHFTGFYFHALLAPKRRKLLPKTLWFGSSNAMAVRILRAVVQEAGGYNLGHDHGRSIIFSYNTGELGTVFDFCDEFVTYSTLLAAQAKKQGDDITAGTVDGKPIKFTGFDDMFIRPGDIETYQKTAPKETVSPRRPKIMFVAGSFFGERFAGLNCLPPDITALDFQARFFGRSIEAGFDILLKAHPEARIRYPDSILKNPDIELAGGFVEDAMLDADVIVFDFMSSAFKTLIMTEKPMIFLDFGYSKMPPDLLPLFEKRVVTMPGFFDAQNRGQIAWGDLPAAVERAKEKAGDKTVLREVYGVRSL